MTDENKTSGGCCGSSSKPTNIGQDNKAQGESCSTDSAAKKDKPAGSCGTGSCG